MPIPRVSSQYETLSEASSPWPKGCTTLVTIGDKKAISILLNYKVTMIYHVLMVCVLESKGIFVKRLPKNHTREWVAKLSMIKWTKIVLWYTKTIIMGSKA